MLRDEARADEHVNETLLRADVRDTESDDSLVGVRDVPVDGREMFPLCELPAKHKTEAGQSQCSSRRSRADTRTVLTCRDPRTPARYQASPS